MNFQTIINHEITLTKTICDMAGAGGYAGFIIEFKIKNSNKVLNNTITLKNLIRTSDNFKQLIAKECIFNLKEDIRDYTHQGNPYLSADIYPKSGSKGVVHIRLPLTNEIKQDLEASILRALGSI